MYKAKYDIIESYYMDESTPYGPVLFSGSITSSIPIKWLQWLSILKSCSLTICNLKRLKILGTADYNNSLKSEG